MLDLLLAIIHHLLIFAVFGIILFEMLAVQPGMSLQAVKRVAAVDSWYGAFAGLILLVGFSRAIFAAKGWPYYSHNHFFWAKIGIFVVIGLLSIKPTVSFIRWRKANVVPGAAQIAGVRRFIHLQTMLFPLLLIFAAAMARGYGEVLPE